MVLQALWKQLGDHPGFCTTSLRQECTNGFSPRRPDHTVCESNQELALQALVPPDIPVPSCLLICVILFLLPGMRLSASPCSWVWHMAAHCQGPAQGSPFCEVSHRARSSLSPVLTRLCCVICSQSVSLWGPDPFRVGTLSFLSVSISAPTSSFYNSSAFALNSATWCKTAELNS